MSLWIGNILVVLHLSSSFTLPVGYRPTGSLWYITSPQWIDRAHKKAYWLLGHITCWPGRTLPGLWESHQVISPFGDFDGEILKIQNGRYFECQRNTGSLNIIRSEYLVEWFSRLRHSAGAGISRIPTGTSVGIPGGCGWRMIRRPWEADAADGVPPQRAKQMADEGICYYWIIFYHYINGFIGLDALKTLNLCENNEYQASNAPKWHKIYYLMKLHNIRRGTGTCWQVPAVRVLGSKMMNTCDADGGWPGSPSMLCLTPDSC